LIKPIVRREYGVLTTSFGLVTPEAAFFIDNGSGVINVSQYILASGAREVYGLQTHWHHDHTNSLQTNSLLFQEDVVKSILAPKLGEKSFQQIFDHDFCIDVWPISPHMFGIRHTIREFEPGVTLSLPVPVKTFRLSHPGGAVGYRFECEGGAVVIATDHEIAGGDEVEFAHFIAGAELLYIDVQYRDSEYAGKVGIGHAVAMSRKGWGHSTPSMLGSVLSRTGDVPKVVVIGHHDPCRDDQDLRMFEKEVIHALKPLGSEIRFARECDSYEV
jgi:phosphoribosyl 1,2-cyclic phosphodiesterase